MLALAIGLGLATAFNIEVMTSNYGSACNSYCDVGLHLTSEYEGGFHGIDK